MRAIFLTVRTGSTRLENKSILKIKLKFSKVIVFYNLLKIILFIYKLILVI